MKHAVLLSLFGVLVFSCGVPPAVPDGGADSGIVDDDAGVVTPVDAGADAGTVDAGEEYAGVIDAGAEDAGLDDAGPGDAGLEDAGSGDAGVPDAGTPDAGVDAGTVSDGGLIDGCPAPSFSAPAFTLRAMAANLTSGNLQSYDPGHGQRIMQGAQPDIVMIQEFNYGSNSATAISDFVSATFDGGFHYQRGNGQIPNGIISRWPLLAQGEWVDPQVSNRGFTWAKVDLPGPNDLWVVSVHLLTANAGTRNSEAQALITRFNQNIPATDYLLLGGDFNTDNRSEACFGTFSSRLHTAGPHPADQDGVEGTNASRSKPYDIVLASPCLARRQTPTVIGTSVYDAGLVLDTQVYTPLSEIAPAQYGDSAASNMQHMGVVKDFLIQP
jgi:endonuclease/exonuclease/phosphatase family metal-dependent hydrolase